MAALINIVAQSNITLDEITWAAGINDRCTETTYFLDIDGTCIECGSIQDADSAKTG